MLWQKLSQFCWIMCKGMQWTDLARCHNDISSQYSGFMSIWWAFKLCCWAFPTAKQLKVCLMSISKEIWWHGNACLIYVEKFILICPVHQLSWLQRCLSFFCATGGACKCSDESACGIVPARWRWKYPQAPSVGWQGSYSAITLTF